MFDQLFLVGQIEEKKNPFPPHLNQVKVLLPCELIATTLMPLSSLCWVTLGSHTIEVVMTVIVGRSTLLPLELHFYKFPNQHSRLRPHLKVGQGLLEEDKIIKYLPPNLRSKTHCKSSKSIPRIL